MESNEYIFGIRAVMEAVEAGKEIDKVLIKKDFQGELCKELLGVLRNNEILVQRVPVEKLNKITRKNHQGVIALLSAVTYHRLDNIVPQLYEDGMLPFIVVLDGITDVRNFGAIARTCECAGVDAIVIPERGSVSVGGDAVKTSAGALLHLPVCRERSVTGGFAFSERQRLQDCRSVGESRYQLHSVRLYCARGYCDGSRGYRNFARSPETLRYLREHTAIRTHRLAPMCRWPQEWSCMRLYASGFLPIWR